MPSSSNGDLTRCRARPHTAGERSPATSVVSDYRGRVFRKRMHKNGHEEGRKLKESLKERLSDDGWETVTRGRVKSASLLRKPDQTSNHQVKVVTSSVGSSNKTRETCLIEEEKGENSEGRSIGDKEVAVEGGALVVGNASEDHVRVTGTEGSGEVTEGVTEGAVAEEADNDVSNNNSDNLKELMTNGTERVEGNSCLLDTNRETEKESLESVSEKEEEYRDETIESRQEVNGVRGKVGTVGENVSEETLNVNGVDSSMDAANASAVGVETNVDGVETSEEERSNATKLSPESEARGIEQVKPLHLMDLEECSDEEMELYSSTTDVSYC